jgi:hypothetical protein
MSINANVQEDYKDFLILVCPRCYRNVAYYNNKVDIISNRLIKKLIAKKRLRCCGSIDIPSQILPEHGFGKGLTVESLIDLKILLETSKDVDEFISKI